LALFVLLRRLRRPPPFPYTTLSRSTSAKNSEGGEMMNPFRRAAKTAGAGGLGFLGGILLEHGIEAVTGLDFVDGVLAVAGAVVGIGAVNRDVIETAARQIERRFGVPAH